MELHCRWLGSKLGSHSVTLTTHGHGSRAFTDTTASFFVKRKASLDWYFGMQIIQFCNRVVLVCETVNHCHRAHVGTEEHLYMSLFARAAQSLRHVKWPVAARCWLLWASSDHHVESWGTDTKYISPSFSTVDRSIDHYGLLFSWTTKEIGCWTSWIQKIRNRQIEREKCF